MRASEHDTQNALLRATPNRSLVASFCGDGKRPIWYVRFLQKTHVTPYGSMSQHLTLGGLGRAP